MTHDYELILKLHKKIMAVKPNKWLGDKAKERVIQRGIYEIIHDDEAVDTIFNIVKEQDEYYDK